MDLAGRVHTGFSDSEVRWISLGTKGVKMAKRRTFAAPFNARVAKEELRGDKTVRLMATTHRVHPIQVSEWKCKASEGLVQRFERGAKTGPSGFWPRLLALAGALTALASLGAVACNRTERPDLQVYPRHFQLRLGEAIRYTPMRRVLAGGLRFDDTCEFSTGNPQILELEDPRGLVRAIAPGETKLVAKCRESQRQYGISVRGPALPPIQTVHHSEVDTIRGEELLFVGHANRDGFDHTAVAKFGIDRLVRNFKARGIPVVYWVSEEYPGWYTEDWQPDLAIVTEGQEHEILIDADRVVFTGGSFMFCLLRNVQMTLHGMIRAASRDALHFVFPLDAIWALDDWESGSPRPYPAPMVLPGSRLAAGDTAAHRYQSVIVPFLDRLFTEYPVADYPPDAPSPDLGDLIEGWSVDVAVGDSFTQSYRRADSTKTILMEFRGP